MSYSLSLARKDSGGNDPNDIIVISFIDLYSHQPKSGFQGSCTTFYSASSHVVHVGIIIYLNYKQNTLT